MKDQTFLVKCVCLNLVSVAIWTVVCVQGITENCVRKLDSISCNDACPDKIPNGVSKVECYYTEQKRINISNELFIDRTWINVEELSIVTQPSTTIQANAFHMLHLTTLGLHAEYFLHIETASFNGLQSLQVLNLSYSPYVSLDTVTEIIKETNIMPRLNTIILTRVDTAVHKSLNISRNFLTAIASTNISTIDTSNTLILELPIDDFIDLLCNRNLRFICSHCYLNHFQISYRKCNYFNLFDIRFSKVLTLFPTQKIPQNVFIPVIANMVKWFNFYTHVDTVFLDGVIATTTPYVLRNISLYIMGNDTMTNKYMSFASNKISYFDVKFLNFFKRIETLDFSSNDMGYIQPQLLPEHNALRQLVLSNNNLNLMSTKNYTDFKHLTCIYKHLQNIYLNNNKLYFLPEEMFSNNSELHSIDLSNNRFEQINFTLHGNKYLQHLNMSANKITLLSRYSIGNIQLAIKRNKSFTVDLRHNDLLCDECKCKDFIQWIVTEKNAILTDATCYNGKTTVSIDEHILSEITSMCQLQTRIILTWSLAVCIFFILSLLIFVSVKAVKKYLATSVRKYKIKQIREDTHKFRFVTFLAFSGDDEDFVEDNVKLLLEAQLRETVGTDRELICTGDRHFELGHTIADQMDISCQRCGSVIFVVSESFCRSPHCNNELHIAYVNQKPIILMFKEHIDESYMSPLLQVVFKQFTRLTWKVKEDKYILSASWKHICDSLIDNMGNS